ncbi:hypothetical protein B0H14DRAFT_2987487, partial [Mycena olivaceomarginata]
NIFYQKNDGATFTASFIAENGSEEQGTWMAAYPKKSPPAHKLPMNDGNSRAHRMVLALRCPTGAPDELRTLFRNGLAVCDAVRGQDEEREAESNQHFDVTEWVMCKGDATDDDIVLLARLHPTYEVLSSDGRKDAAPRTPRKRISKVDSSAKTTAPSNEGSDAPMATPDIAERKIGDRYPPGRLSDHQGPYFAHQSAELVQRDYTDTDSKLIAPHELYQKLTEGTLVLVMLSFATYVITGQTTEAGRPIPNKKVYHVPVDRLRILDHGDGEPWNPARRGRDDAADRAFNNFGAKSASPSPPKRARRNSGTQ